MTSGTWLDGTTTSRPAEVFEELFNIESYGAVGDGTTNDTTAINAAIAAAVAAGGGTVWFPKSIYLANGIVISGNNVQLLGSGWGTVLKQTAAAADNTYLLSSFGTGTTAASNRFNLSVRNMQLLGRADTDTFTQYVHLLEFSGVSDALVENVFFNTWRGDGFILASNQNGGTQVERHNERITMRDCKFDGGAAQNNRNGITVIDGTDVLVENCFFTSCSAAGMPGAIDLEPNANAYHRLRNVTVKECTFDAVEGAAGVVGYFLTTAQASLTTPVRGILIENNTFRNCTNGAGPIYIHHVQTPTVTTERSDIVVRGNRVFDCVGPPLEAEGVRGLEVSGNYFYGSEQGLAFGYAYKMMDTIVRENIFQKVGLVGGTCVHVYTNDRLRIEANVFDNIGDQAGTGRLLSFEAGSGGVSTSTEVEFIRNRVIGTQATTVSSKAGGHTLSVDTNAYLENDTQALVPSSLHWALNETLDGEPVVTITYSASMTPDASLGRYQKITPTNTTAMTINAPTAPITGTRLLLDFLNSSGGTMGAVTWNAAFKLAGAFTNPASTKRRTIEFVYDGTNWIEISRAAADI